SADQTALPGGKWCGGALEPHDPRTPGWGRVDEPGAGPGGICPDHPALQRRAVAQRFGLPAADGLLSWRSAEPARSPQVKTGARPTPPPRTKPETGTRNFTLRYGRNHRYNVRSICAIVDETNQRITAANVFPRNRSWLQLRNFKNS